MIGVQAGLHTIYAHIDHEAVEGSPLVLDAKPGAPCLAASRLNESALTSAVAGEHCSVLLTAFNEFGDPINDGGAVITATLMSHGKISFLCLQRELIVACLKPSRACSRGTFSGNMVLAFEFVM